MSHIHDVNNQYPSFPLILICKIIIAFPFCSISLFYFGVYRAIYDWFMFLKHVVLPMWLPHYSRYAPNSDPILPNNMNGLCNYCYSGTCSRVEYILSTQ